VRRPIAPWELSLGRPSPRRKSPTKMTLDQEQMARRRTALPWGFFPLRRLQEQAATYTKFTSLGCAPSSGFLNLLTSFSARSLSALFRAESVPGVEALRGFPLPVAATTFAARCPSDDRREGPGCAPKRTTTTARQCRD